MKKATKILLLVLAMVLIVGILLVVWNVYSPSAAEGDKTITVTVVHSDGSNADFTIHTNEAYLAPALEAEKLIIGKVEDYGLFIDTVDGEFADADKGQWWVFTVNGEMGMYGADTQPIEDGDVFAFSLYES